MNAVFVEYVFDVNVYGCTPIGVGVCTPFSNRNAIVAQRQGNNPVTVGYVLRNALFVGG